MWVPGKDRDRVSKGSDQDGGEGLGPEDKGHPQGRVGVAGAEVWDREEVRRSQRKAELASFTDQPARNQNYR